MFVAMVISTLLWITVTLFSAPEREAILVDFYRRSRPLGWWEPVRKAAGLQASSRLRFPIPLGIALALVGAASVMAFITGISQVYVGRYYTGALLLGFMMASGILFLATVPRYVKALLLPDEDRKPAASVPLDGPVADPIALHGVFAIVCFATAMVLILHALLWQGGAASFVAGIASAALGLLLRRNRDKVNPSRQEELTK
jgi:hypothetical protein